MKKTKETTKNTAKQPPAMPITMAEQIKQSQSTIDNLFEHFDIDEKSLNKSALKKHEKAVDKLFDAFGDVHGPVFMSDLYSTMYQGIEIASGMLNLIQTIERIPDIKIEGGFAEMRELIKDYMSTLGVNPHEVAFNRDLADDCECPKHTKERNDRKEGLH